MTIGKILLVGCGKMGSALLEGWLSANVANDITIIEETNQVSHLRQKYHLNVVDSFDKVSAEFDVIIICVKPQIIDNIINDIKCILKPSTLVISILAGRKISYFENHLGSNFPIIRSMPNLPATIREGVTAIYGNKNVSNELLEKGIKLFDSVGETVVLDSENKMDAVTAISGSGPAYLFLFAESLIEAAEEIGFDKELAEKLAKITISGSCKLLLESKENPSSLRKNVTSPKGTTEAALNILCKDNKFKELIIEAVKAAENRSKELA